MPTSAGQTRPAVILAVAAGGMVGAAARYGLARIVPSLGDGFPWDTVIENIVGSALLGLVLVVAAQHLSPRSLLRPFLAVGVLGSFTTFSAFAVEGTLLVRDGEAVRALLAWTSTLSAGLAAALAGIVWGGRLLRRIGRPA